MTNLLGLILITGVSLQTNNHYRDVNRDFNIYPVVEVTHLAFVEGYQKGHYFYLNNTNKTPMVPMTRVVGHVYGTNYSYGKVIYSEIFK